MLPLAAAAGLVVVVVGGVAFTYLRAQSLKFKSPNHVFATVGQPFSYPILTTTAASQVQATNLASWLKFDPAAYLISGTPTSAGETDFELVASSGSLTANQAVNISIFPPPSPLPNRSDKRLAYIDVIAAAPPASLPTSAPVITATTLPPTIIPGQHIVAYVGRSLDSMVRSSHAEIIRISHVSPPLPAGLTLDYNGRIHGVAESAGSETVVLFAISGSAAASDQVVVDVSVHPDDAQHLTTLCTAVVTTLSDINSIRTDHDTMIKLVAHRQNSIDPADKEFVDALRPRIAAIETKEDNYLLQLAQTLDEVYAMNPALQSQAVRTLHDLDVKNGDVAQSVLASVLKQPNLPSKDDVKIATDQALSAVKPN